MLYFLLRIFLLYLFFRFVFKVIHFSIILLGNRVKRNNRDKSCQKTRNQPFNYENIVDAEFREIE